MVSIVPIRKKKISKFLAKKLREHGHYEMKAKNTSLGDLQENSYPMDKELKKEYEEALRTGKLKEFMDNHKGFI